MSKLKTSPSRMSDFFSCPAKFKYHQDFKIVGEMEPVPALENGTAVHALLEGKIDGFTMNPEVDWYFKKINNLRHEEGYEIIGTETFQTVDVGDHQLMRVIDAFAFIGDEPVLVDYKTASWKWDSFADRYPQAKGFQATAYLIPPDDPAPFEEWPTRIDFLIAPRWEMVDNRRLTGTPEVVSYYQNDEDLQNLIDALDHIASTKVFVKNRGYNCRTCSMAGLCFDLPNMEGMYERKKK